MTVLPESFGGRQNRSSACRNFSSRLWKCRVKAIEPRALSLSNPNLPIPLLNLLVELEKCNNGTNVIPVDLSVEIEENKAKHDPSFRTIDPHMFLGVTDCTDAKIICEYLPTDAQAKMPDFRIYVDVKTGTLAVDTANRQRRSDHVINHTKY